MLFSLKYISFNKRRTLSCETFRDNIRRSSSYSKKSTKVSSIQIVHIASVHETAAMQEPKPTRTTKLPWGNASDDAKYTYIMYHIPRLNDNEPKIYYLWPNETVVSTVLLHCIYFDFLAIHCNAHRSQPHMNSTTQWQSSNDSASFISKWKQVIIRL